MESKKNYGNNVKISFCGKKYIIGNNTNICLLIGMTFIYTIILIFWILLLYQLYSLFIFILGILLYLSLIYYYLKSFFTEPGIIPRNYPKYILNNIKTKKINVTESDLISFQNLENSTKTELGLENNSTSINNIHDMLEENKNTEKKQNKIFPDFIVADSAEDLKMKNKLDNSINGWKNNSILGKIIFEQDESIFSKQDNTYINNKIMSKNNSQDVLKNKKDIDINEKNNIPHIFQKRPCKTCNIIRPPKASHCVICDNCIMDLDHHCFYISNCVGARNRKYFILFLIYGFLLSIFCLFTSLYHFIFICFIQKQNKYLTILLFKKYYIPISISIVIMLIGIIILLIKKESLKLSIIFFVPGKILFDFYFYYNKNKNEITSKKIIDFKYHPFSISLIYSLLPLLLFVSNYLRKQIKLLGKGLSYKQYLSIKEERNNNKKKREIYDYLNSIINRKISFNNIIKFFLSKQTKSLINNTNNKKKNIEEN